MIAFRKKVDWFLGWMVTILMGVLVINVLWQVASRFIVGRPSGFTDELAGFLLIWVGLFGAAYASGQKQHLAIDLLSAKLSAKGRLIQFILINVLISFFAIIVLVLGGANLVYITWYLEQISSALLIPIAWVYLVLPVSGLFILFYAITDIIMAVKAYPPEA